MTALADRRSHGVFLRLADWVILSWGWQRRLFALGAGACGALALAPFGLWPLMAIPMFAAIWLIDGATSQGRASTLWRAFCDGWWWGFGYHLAGLWWLGAAFLVEADRFAWAMPLGVIALPAGLALFSALAFAMARLIWSGGPSRILAFALALALTEWLRGHVFTGFPWNSHGMALAENLALAQTASITGLYGLTLLAALALAAPAVLATGATAIGRWAPPTLAVLLLAAMGAFGLWRLPVAPSPLVPDVRLRILQPNLPQDAKFRPEAGEAILSRYLALSDRATGPRTLGLQDVSHLIWPESAFPFLLARAPGALSRIQAALPAQATLITGAARAGEVLPGESRPPIYNSIQVITKHDGIVASADKHHLVPFGEYLPAIFDRLLRSVGLKEFVAIPGGFASASELKSLRIPRLPLASPLICYEVVFPGSVIPRGARPGLLLNVTNDGWFGRTTGPHQHFAQARLRAIEEGLPLVRAANTGISGVVDGYGRTIARLELGREDVLDSGLPRALASTVYSRVGDGVFVLLTVIVASGIFGAQWSRRSNSSS
jgi:apolipoprotein N-acyltransferase